jgi:serine/threonine protein kinase
MEFQIKTLAQHFEEFEREGASTGFKLLQAMVAAQAAIELLFRLHSKRIIHRDIKPDNFMYNVRPQFFLFEILTSIMLALSHIVRHSG